MTTTPVPAPTRHAHDVRNAWISIACFPFVVLAVMVLGDFMLSWAGYDSADPNIPLGVRAAVGLPLVVIAVVPSLLGAWFGRRARRAGDNRGFAPLVVGLTLTVIFVLQNSVGFLFG